MMRGRAMPCKDCQPKAERFRAEPVAPCLDCVREHLRQAQLGSDRLRDRYRAYWHLARAAELAAEPLRRRLVAARIAWQRDGKAPDWGKLVDDKPQ